MKAPKFSNLAVFVIFFGLATVEAFNSQNIWEISIFGALGLMSLFADLGKK